MKNYKIINAFKKNPNILEWEVTSKPGDKILSLTKGTDRIGKVITKGKSVKDAENLAKKFKLAFKIHVNKSNKKYIL